MSRKSDAISNMDKHIASKINEARLSAGWGLEELGNVLDVTHQQARKYCTGENRITAGRLMQLSKALKLPAAFFFSGSPLKTDGTLALNLLKKFSLLTAKKKRVAWVVISNL